MGDKPLISIIIPVYNGEQYLAEAIESALAQTYRPVEVIVVDDGSTDRSADIAKRFAPPVRIFSQPHKGLGTAWNHGIEQARGPFLAFLDADDLWVEEKLAYQMEAFEQDPGLDIVFGHVEQFLSPELERVHVRCPSGSLPPGRPFRNRMDGGTVCGLVCAGGGTGPQKPDVARSRDEKAAAYHQYGHP